MDTDSDLARFNMIYQQVRPWDVLDDRVLGVMEAIEREPFVPAAYQGLAYADIEVPLEGGRTLLPPKVVGRMLQALAVRPGDKVLEIGSGTGYATACLCRLGARVTGVEPIESLASVARARLDELNCPGVQILELDPGAQSFPGGPFDAIAVDGSLPDLEGLAPFEQQLAVTGRLFCIVGAPPVMGAYLVTRVSPRDLRREILFETSAAPLLQTPHVPDFVF